MDPLAHLLFVALTQVPSTPAPTDPNVPTDRSDRLPIDERLAPVRLRRDEFVAAGEAARAGIADQDLILGVTLGQESRAYPIAIVATSEVVNDDVAGVAIAITW